MSELCFTFFFNYWYYWSWVVGTANIKFVLTMQRKLLHSISPPLYWEMQVTVSNFEKGGLGNLCMGCLPCSLSKKKINIKRAFEGSISKADRVCFSQATNWCLVLWHFGSVKSLNSIQNLPWHSAMSRHIYIFTICLSKNNAKAIEFLGIIKTTFPRIRKYILLFKKEKCFTQ